jgi:hypothetical protein
MLIEFILIKTFRYSLRISTHAVKSLDPQTCVKLYATLSVRKLDLASQKARLQKLWQAIKTQIPVNKQNIATYTLNAT